MICSYVFTCASWCGLNRLCSDAGWQGPTISVLGRNGPVMTVKMAFCFDRCRHQWQCLWLCHNCLFNLYSTVWIGLLQRSPKNAKEGLMLAVRHGLLHSKPEVWLGQQANGNGTSPLGKATRAEAFAVPFGISLTFHLSDERLKHVQNTSVC